MGIRSAFAGMFKARRAPVGSSPIGASLSFGFPANWSTSQYVSTYGSVGWVYACVSRIAQSIGEAEFHLYSGKKENATEVEEHPLLDLLKNPNPFMTGQECAETCQTFLELTGEWVWLIFRDGLTIRELWPVNPSKSR